jgi:hypothetical protein
VWHSRTRIRAGADGVAANRSEDRLDQRRGGELEMTPLIPFRLAEGTRDLLVLTALLLLVDLSLEWRELSVRGAGVAVDAGASAWGGWGGLAGVLLVAYVVLDVAAGRPVEAAAAALAASGFVVLEFFTGAAEVDVAGVVSVSRDELWPAYAGLGLAVALAVGAGVQLAARIRGADDDAYDDGLFHEHPSFRPGR